MTAPSQPLPHGTDLGSAPLGRPDGTGSEDMEKLLLRPSEAAAHLSIGRSKVYELMRLGQLRSVKIGRVPAYPTGSPRRLHRDNH